MYTVAIKDDGTLWAWGRNSYGQLGNGTTDDKYIPAQVSGDTWISVVSSAMSDNTVAIKSDGTLWAWGREGSFVGAVDKHIPSPTALTDPVPSSAWIAIFAGSASGHIAALKEDGTLWTWGNNEDGQLGDGTSGDPPPNSFVPVTDPDPSITWIAASTGGEHTVAIKSNGTLWTWGRNNYGELGNGTTDYKHIPSPIADPDSSIAWVAVSAGNAHTVAIKSNGTLWAWGYNNYGQLGDNTITYSLKPIQIGKDRWKGVTAGGASTMAIREDGTLWAWGDNRKGQLGDGTTKVRTTPTRVIHGE